MLNKIIGTVATRGLIAIISFILVIVNARHFGAEGVGTISLIMLAVAINQLFSGLIGTGSLVYFFSRENKCAIYFLSVGWDIISTLLGTFILYICHLIPEGYAIAVVALSLAISLNASNLMMLMGNEKIRLYNIITLITQLVILTYLLVSLYFLNLTSITTYIYAQFTGYCIGLALSIPATIPLLKPLSLHGIKTSFKSLFKFGLFGQMANTFQMFNYRLSYYIIDYFLGRHTLGVFDVGTKLSEGMWIVGRSIGTVEYTTISNMKDHRQTAKLALQFLKITFAATFAMLFVLLLLPENFYLYLFGNDFSGIKTAIITLSLGVLSLACSITMSQYFSGIGKVHVNTVSSGIGLACITVLGFSIIPSFAGKDFLSGLTAIGIIVSITYTISFIYQSIIFRKINQTALKDYLINKEDINRVKQLLGIKKQRDNH